MERSSKEDRVLLEQLQVELREVRQKLVPVEDPEFERLRQEQQALSGECEQLRLGVAAADVQIAEGIGRAGVLRKLNPRLRPPPFSAPLEDGGASTSTGMPRTLRWWVIAGLTIGGLVLARFFQ